jgi:hypothetical protein
LTSRDRRPATQQLDRTRASDTERDAAVERLQVAFADGRLASTEFAERMRSALTARTPQITSTRSR